MSRGGSELVRQDVLGGLGRRVLYWGAKKIDNQWLEDYWVFFYIYIFF